MRKIEITHATHDYISHVAQYMRQADIDELAACGTNPEAALLYGFYNSGECYAGLIDSEPICIFGITLENEGGNAIPWLLGTDAIDRNRKVFMRESQLLFSEFCARYRYMRNWVDVRNVKSIAWLKWLGFQVGAPEPYGPYGLPFCPFWKEVI